MTREEFIKRAIEVHSINYDYSLIPEKIISKDKAKIICSEHGIFECRVDMFLRGYNCYKCSCKLKTKTNEQFIKRAIEIHGNKYDYSKLNYKPKTKLTIICPEHGEFEQLGSNHLAGQGCPKCANKDTSEEFFLEKARKIHDNKYDYSKVNYVHSQCKITIICPEHGEFEQRPNAHLQGSGCPKCGLISSGIKQRLSHEEFIKRAIEIHGNKYDYSETEYIDANSYVKIRCNKHNYIFEQIANQHLRGHEGCPECKAEIIKSKIKKNKIMGFTFNQELKDINKFENNKSEIIQFIEDNMESKQDIFINKAKQIFPQYDYSKVIFKTTKTPVIVSCPEHGEFLIKPEMITYYHSGCPECMRKIKASKNIDTETFVNRAKQIFPNYDYSKVDYKTMKTKIIVSCPEHGEFTPIPCNLLNGSGCPECGNKRSSNKRTLTTDQFLARIRKIHGNKYDYSITEYTGLRNKIKYICPKHGIIEQYACNHFNGEGCPQCALANNTSKAENEIANFLGNILLKNDRTILGKQELDIYIPSKKLAIEYDGLYWHSEFNKPNNYHLQKTTECEKKGIQLIHIFEDEWLDKRSIVEARLLNLLGKNKWSIGARKCKIKQVPVEEERQFLNNNHLQGYVASTVCYGLYYFNVKNQKEYLVALMSFGPLRKNLGSSNQEGCYELYRFVTMKNFSVPGGASRLFKYFIKKFSPKQVLSFADRRWSIRSEKNLYEQLGFQFDSYTEPGYFYVQGTKRINRFSLRKDVLIKEYGCPPSISEHDFCQQQGWLRIYDVGQLKYIWK